MALTSGRIPLSPKEASALDQLLGGYPDAAASFTRTEPGENGPLRVEIEDQAWLIDERGNIEEVT